MEFVFRVQVLDRKKKIKEKSFQLELDTEMGFMLMFVRER